MEYYSYIEQGTTLNPSKPLKSAVTLDSRTGYSREHLITSKVNSSSFWACCHPKEEKNW